MARSSVDEGGAFDDALADVFKQLYPSGGVKRIKWGVFKEDRRSPRA